MTVEKEKHTSVSIVKFIVFSLAALLLSQGCISLFSPDQDQSGKRTLMASKQSGLVHRLHQLTILNRVQGDSGNSDVLEDWREGHQLLNDQFTAAERSASEESQFTELNRAYYRIEELLSANGDLFDQASLAAQIDTYSQAADRIFLTESSQLNAAMEQHTWVVVGATLLSVLLIFVFFQVFVRKQLNALEQTRLRMHEEVIESLELNDRLKNFMLKVTTGFSSDLDKLRQHERPENLGKDFLRLQRTARSAKVFSEFLLDLRPDNQAPFSLDALLQDVSDYLTLHSEFSASSVEYSVVSSHRSAAGNTDLIGTLLSQLLIVLLELPDVKKVRVFAGIEPAEEQRSRLAFSFQVEAAPTGDPVGLATLLRALPQRVNTHFGMAMADGIVKMLNARFWLNEGKPGLPEMNISLACASYDDEVAFGDTGHLQGKRVFVMDSQTEHLRLLVKQLSGYGIQATPFNSLLPILENPALLARFDGGILVHREEQEGMADFVRDVRKRYSDQDLPLLAIYPQETVKSTGIEWNALLSGTNTEAELLSALAFCMLPASRREAESKSGTSSIVQPFALQRENR